MAVVKYRRQAWVLCPLAEGGLHAFGARLLAGGVQTARFSEAG